MSYLAIIPLSTAKSYLGVDDTYRDKEIESMIKSALSFIEKETNHIMDVRDKVYRLREGCITVYDYPINTLDADLASSVEREEYGLYSTYSDSNSSNKTLTLNVGSLTVEPELIEAGLQIVDYFFHNKEGDKTKIPLSAKMLIDKNRRFII